MKHLGILRDARWITPDRIRAVAVLSALAFGAVAILLVVKGGGRDPFLGFDYASFWSASVLLLEGQASAAYDTATHFGVQRREFDGVVPGWSAFFYPPVFLLFCAPLALLPFAWSLVAWTVVTAGALIAAMVRLAGRRAIVPALAFPALWVNAGFGQNGALSAALLAWGALQMDRRPVLAGLCFGSLCYKPQIALAIPVALIATRRWRVFAAAAATVVVYVLASLVLFGPETWQGFLQQSPMARAGLETGEVGFEKIVSVFAAARMLGAAPGLAYAVQAMAAALALVALWLLLRTRPGGVAEGAAIVAATIFCSPFLLVYDLLITALPIAWLATRGRTGGRPLPWEAIGLAVLATTPLASWWLTRALEWQTAPMFALLLFWLVGRRIRAEGPDRQYSPRR